MLRSTLLTLALLVAPVAAFGHHGLMLWQDDVVTTIEGFLSEDMDGFPHWEISVRTPDGNDWEVDIGSEFEMDKAGLKAEDLTIGTEVRVEGNRPRESDALLLRPLRIFVGDKVYEFRGNWN